MWDRKLDTADYPLWDKQPVGLFDIKEYVRECPWKENEGFIRWYTPSGGTNLVA